jgi:hypothetical protein
VELLPAELPVQAEVQVRLVLAVQLVLEQAAVQIPAGILSELAAAGKQAQKQVPG